MPRSSTKPAVLLLAVASVLTLLVGLVGSADRTTSSPRALPPAEPRAPARASVVLRTPVPPSAQEVEPQSTPPKTAKKSARSARRSVTGIVLRPEGEPAAGARVALGRKLARCDAEGRFELELFDDNGAEDLLAFESGHEPVLRAAFGASIEANGEHSVRLVLGPETLTLSGTVVGASGSPLAGWSVELDELDPLADLGLREQVLTNGNGQFSFGDVPAGVHVLRAWKERRELSFRSQPAAAGESGITIRVEE
jgi:hypothetical protein